MNNELWLVIPLEKVHGDSIYKVSNIDYLSTIIWKINFFSTVEDILFITNFNYFIYYDNDFGINLGNTGVCVSPTLITLAYVCHQPW